MIAKSQDINTVLLDVNEEIKQNNLRKFILTSLSLENIELKQENLYVSYLSRSNKYQVFIFDKKFSFLELDIFQCFYENKSDSIDIFLCDEFFVLYINQEFYYYQKLNYEINNEDLVEYIHKNLNLKVDNIYKISLDEREVLKNKYIESSLKTKLINISEIKNKSFTFFISFVLLLVVSILVYLYYLYSMKDNLLSNINIQNKNSFLDYKNKHKYKYLNDDVKYLLSELLKHDLILDEFVYKENQLELSFFSKNRNSIYSFLDLYKNKLDGNSIKFIKDKKVYICNANIKTFRK